MTRLRSVLGGRRGALMLVVTAALAGLVALVVAVATQQPEPPTAPESIGRIQPPPAPASSPPDNASPDPDPTPSPPTEETAEPPLGPSEPVRIQIPRIEVASEVFAIGKAADGSLAVPQPGPNLDKAAWFENSPTPGQPGPSIIEGHVATAQSGPSVFFDLAKLRPGDRIRVERQDGRIAIFEVDALRTFDKDRFPTRLVYGGDLTNPSLRLITCTDFDPGSGRHTGNLIVFASLTDIRGT